MHLSTPPSEVLFYAPILTCVWGSLRWGDALWCPPNGLVTMVDKDAVVGVCIRTKTTKRSTPFAFLLSGPTGSASSSWATRYITVLRQSVADTPIGMDRSSPQLSHTRLFGHVSSTYFGAPQVRASGYYIAWAPHSVPYKPMTTS